MASDDSSSGIDLDTLLGALPACKRCRKTRRRCDTLLPSCEKCVRAGAECVYYDHVLQEELPRSYVASLVDHLERDTDQLGFPPGWPDTQEQVRSGDTATDLQHYFAFSQGVYRYLGPQSLLLDVRLPGEGLRELYERRILGFPSQAVTNDGLIAPDLHRFLLRLFFDSIHQIYPVLDPSLSWPSRNPAMGLDAPPAEVFVLHMICAIACHCDEEHSSSLLPLASAVHARALKFIDKATTEPSISTLQVATLLVLYTMFNPASGNISQQLGFAIRLAIDLAGSDIYEQLSILLTLHKVIYCLENYVYSVLARPTSLPEPSTPFTLSTEEPLDFLCTLYRIQSRIRGGITDNALYNNLLALDDGVALALHPNIRATLSETRLMLKPSSSVAVHLISAYSEYGYIATFLTPHWVHKAGSLIVDAIATVENPLKAELIQAYGNAVALLAKWSGRWEGARTLLKCLQSRLKEESARSKDTVGR